MSERMGAACLCSRLLILIFTELNPARPSAFRSLSRTEPLLAIWLWSRLRRDWLQTAISKSRLHRPCGKRLFRTLPRGDHGAINIALIARGGQVAKVRNASTMGSQFSLSPVFAGVVLLLIPVAFLSSILGARSPRLEDEVDVHHVITRALLHHRLVLAKTTKVDYPGESPEELVGVSIVVWIAGLCLP